ncbi:MAG: hypothetical protein A2Y93_18120 [Chloroflexi bacterium RBG_13_68_17]|jgi:YgiT-type zinc finger domain-containing protein|nr:MAG: hypothetical protein A2Y93_18120 [Chloroflexi bacterium RBG_13_68_17]
MSAESAYPCPECQLGTVSARRVTYFIFRNGQPVTVPDFPAWVCDVCGRREYDTAALAELQAMLDTGSQPRRRTRRPRPGSDPARPARHDGNRRRP